MNEITFKEVEINKLNLQPDEVLVVKLKGDNFSAYDMDSLKMGFEGILPNNKVVLLALPNDSDIELTIAKGSEYPGLSYCSDCSCGKKAIAEQALKVEDK